MLRPTHRYLLLPLLLLLSVGGCAPYLHQRLTESRARIGAEIESSAVLRQLPEPSERIVVAVYKFRDQTGQYKPTENGASFSTAVTQGATSILLRALEDSRWFNPIERENLGNLLNERKIIRSSRAEYSQMTGKPEPALPSLLFAGVILEGGIISYDANIMTGGAGLRYFGAGASGQYRQDRVTVYLRAISTSTGEILKTVYTTKTILSQQVDASLFRFVKFQRLLEAETGFTYNEPTEMAVKDAIEKSVQALVFEGIQEKLWAPRTPGDATQNALNQYFKEKNENQQIDALGRTQHDRRGRFGVGISGATVRYTGDLSAPRFRAGAELSLHYLGAPGSPWSASVTLGRFQLGAGDFYRETFNYAELTGQYRLYPRDRVTPYLLAGAGATARTQASTSSRVLPHVVAGAGLEVLATDRLAFGLGIDNHYYLSDKLDRVKRGKYNDFYWSGRASLTFYLGRPAVKKPLK
ncbi:CsgG/HfaB family protein [Hymenobacter jejuensis]|uniref:Curli production assembly/transport component CsgG n=1 Tax=Hymenobacter jejuensis TaxID=2502781 RepID=A0A5B7ZYW4_9BACT|nr:CsgG/HfaB family protein [Hymenobacter jejuensis]QDA60218.1 curli production assembly/transport component CsgG [Hymenobacter jejuensis]